MKTILLFSQILTIDKISVEYKLKLKKNTANSSYIWLAWVSDSILFSLESESLKAFACPETKFLDNSDYESLTLITVRVKRLIYPVDCNLGA